MAIKACKECKAAISTDANPCPKCGKKNPHGMSIILWIGAIVGGIIGMCFITGMIAAIAKRSDGTSPASLTAEAAVDVDALTLWKAYEANEVSADNQYKGRSLRVSGVVDSITKDFADDIVVQLAAPNQFQNPMATMRDDQAAVAANLRKGQAVRLLCVGGGAVVSTPQLRECGIEAVE